MKQKIEIKSRPLIGIVVCDIEHNRQFITDTYIQVIRQAGGLPIVIPYIASSPLIHQYATLCNGFIFCGGGDISPLLFGESQRTSIGHVDLHFDIFQIKLLHYIIELRKPILGICRGMQVLNIAIGGSIYQDLSLYPKTTIQHMQLNSNRQEVSHKIQIKRRSKLNKILGSTLYVNSYHHQVIHKLGKGLIASARSNDGVIEGIESSRHPFVVGVQWHPECMISKSKPMQNLFREFVKQSASLPMI